MKKVLKRTGRLPALLLGALLALACASQVASAQSPGYRREPTRGFARDREWVNPLPITLHLRGQTGTKLPSAESLINKRREAASKNPRSFDADLKLFRESRQKLMESRKLPSLPSCGKDRTKYTPYSTPSGKGLLRDVLFIAPDKVPIDAAEAFGKRTIIVRYDPRKRSNWAHYGRINGVTCLPTRLRILGDGAAWHEGTPALKNFDSNVYGEGTLTDAARLHVEGFKDTGAK